MISSFSAVAIILAGTVASVYGLKCHEGFNMSMNGIPLHHWKERTCADNSKCIGQQIGVDMNLNGVIVKTAMRYGACVASAYADYLDCENLFGESSSFDPVDLLNLVPEIEKSINFIVSNFAENITAELHDLLSDGTGTAAFVAGVFKIYEDMGFNVSKLRALEPSLVKLLSALFATDFEIAISAAAMEFNSSLSNLDTDNAEFRAAIRSLLEKLGVKLNLVVDNTMLRTIINKIPELIRSTFPSGWHPELWYDVSFKLVGNVDPSNWTKTAEDVIATIKTSYQIPDDVRAYVIPMLDRIPDLVKGLQTNPTYGARWSLELLKHFSSTDNATIAFSTALINLIEKITNATLQPEFKDTIKWIPGLFYSSFPGDKATIQDVYNKMAEGFNSFNFANLSITAPETKLSMMIKNLITTFGGQTLFQSNPFVNAAVVNFSQMFYKLMNTTTYYTTYVDIFATVISDEFGKWPLINAGTMITNLVTGMGGTVPPEVQPLLNNVQPVITAAMGAPPNATNLISMLNQITEAYKLAFPGSPFPELASRFINIMYNLINATDATQSFSWNMQLQYWNIDLQFAIVKSMNFTNDELHKLILNSWPEFDVYIRAMQAMNPEDVKELLGDIITWAFTPPLTTDGFVTAVQPTFKKMANSISGLLGEIRKIFAPSSCMFGSCDTDLCNTHGYIGDRPVFTKATLQVTQSTTAATTTKATLQVTQSTTAATTTTAAGERASLNILLNIATLWIVHKVFYA